jgi:6-phosphogluconolactonase
MPDGRQLHKIAWTDFAKPDFPMGRGERLYMNHAGSQRCRWHAVADEHVLRKSAVKAILAAAAKAIDERGQFHLVISGGDTPRKIYRSLSTVQTDWSAWHIYFGDERCLPRSDSGRNSQMAAEAWLDVVPIPPDQVHSIAAELGALHAARLYAETLQSVADFDLVLLGLGEDGHTASLFPGHDWGTAAGAPDALAVFGAPKPPPERVSMSATRLSRARQVLFLISGESKREAVSRWRTGKTIPARAITPEAGVDVWVVSALFLPLASRDRADQ